MTGWKKRYGFRLTEDDAEIAEFLEQVPASKRSEVIRQMLRYAYRQMKIEQQEQKQIKKILDEIRSLKESQERSYKALQERLNRLEGFHPAPTQDSEQGKGEQVDDEAVKETAQAMLSSFGLQD